MNKYLKQFLRLLETKNYKHHHIHIMYNTNDFLMTFLGENVNNDSISGRIDYDCNIKIVLLAFCPVEKQPPFELQLLLYTLSIYPEDR